MCVKLPSGYLNLGPYPSQPTSTYTCRVTITPRVCGGEIALVRCQNDVSQLMKN